MKCRQWAVAILASAFAAVSGCGAGADPGSVSGGDDGQTNKVAEVAEQARVAIDPAIQFTNPDIQSDLPCTNEDGSPSEDFRQASVSYQLGESASKMVSRHFDGLRSWWSSNGFTVLKDEPVNRHLWGERKSDRLTMGLQSNDLGQVFMTVNSPCVQGK